MRRMRMSAVVLSFVVGSWGLAQTTPVAGSGAKTDYECAAELARLIPLLASGDLEVRAKAYNDCSSLVMAAGAPGHESERAALRAALLGRCGPEMPAVARVWLLRQLAHIGGDESVDRLVALLNDSEADVREAARRALAHNPSPAATQALCAVLEVASAANTQIAMLNALGERGDATAVVDILPLISVPDATVATAAIAALGGVGDAGVFDALRPLAISRDHPLREPAANALLRVADRLVKTDAAAAGRIYESLWPTDLPVALRAGVLRGLHTARPDSTYPMLVSVMKDGNSELELRVAAVHLLAELDHPGAGRVLAEQLLPAPAVLQVVMIHALADRREMEARAQVMIVLLASKDPAVRLAALESLRYLGDAETVAAMAKLAADTTGDEQRVARESLAQLDAPGTEEALLWGLQHLGPANEAEVARALAARRAHGACDALANAALRDDEVVRVAALEALGELGGASFIPRLMPLLKGPLSEGVRGTLENTLVALSRHEAQADARTAVFISGWTDAGDAARVSLVRVLGRLQGHAALLQIRAARQADDEAVIDAAIRALAAWNTPEPLDDLADVAQHSDSQTFRILALQGYIRLIGLPSERDAQGTVELYRNALQMATRAEERRQVLAGLAKVPDVQALHMIMRAVEDDALRDEAAVAAIASIRLIAPAYPAEACAALDALVPKLRTTSSKEAADSARTFVDAVASSVIRWQLAGPYFEQGQDWQALYDRVFPPEQTGAPGITWRMQPPTSLDVPWNLNLLQAVGGNERCVYLRTTVSTDEDQDVQLAIGSDDAVKVWLNGALVYSFARIRGHTPFGDQAPVHLKAGANVLMLKVVQGAGEWGCSAGFRTANGGPVRGLRFVAK